MWRIYKEIHSLLYFRERVMIRNPNLMQSILTLWPLSYERIGSWEIVVITEQLTHRTFKILFWIIIIHGFLQFEFNLLGIQSHFMQICTAKAWALDLVAKSLTLQPILTVSCFQIPIINACWSLSCRLTELAIAK